MDRDEIKITRSIIGYGLLLDLIMLITDACVRNNNSESLKQIKNLYLSILNSLNDEEKKNIRSRFETIRKEKTEKFTKELSKSGTPDEIKEIVNNLSQEVAA